METATDTGGETPFPDHLSHDTDRQRAYDRMRDMAYSGRKYTLILSDKRQVSNARIRFHDAAKSRLVQVSTKAVELPDGTFKLIVTPYL
jgi:hypothetical protein